MNVTNIGYLTTTVVNSSNNTSNDGDEEASWVAGTDIEVTVFVVITHGASTGRFIASPVESDETSRDDIEGECREESETTDDGHYYFFSFRGLEGCEVRDERLDIEQSSEQDIYTRWFRDIMKSETRTV